MQPWLHIKSEMYCCRLPHSLSKERFSKARRILVANTINANLNKVRWICLVICCQLEHRKSPGNAQQESRMQSFFTRMTLHRITTTPWSLQVRLFRCRSSAVRFTRLVHFDAISFSCLLNSVVSHQDFACGPRDVIKQKRLPVNEIWNSIF